MQYKYVVYIYIYRDLFLECKIDLVVVWFLSSASFNTFIKYYVLFIALKKWRLFVACV